MLNVCFFEQPSIQKLVSNCASECLAHLSEEAVHSEVYREDIPGVLAALDDLEGAFGDSLVDKVLLKEALEKTEARFTEETRKHERNVRHLVACNFRILTHTAVAGICPCCCLKTNHTRLSLIVSVARLTCSRWNSGDINSSPPGFSTACCSEIWFRRPNSHASSSNSVQALILQPGLSLFGEFDCEPLHRSCLLNDYQGCDQDHGSDQDENILRQPRRVVVR